MVSRFVMVSRVVMVIVSLIGFLVLNRACGTRQTFVISLRNSYARIIAYYSYIHNYSTQTAE